MAIPHAEAGEVIDVRPLGKALKDAKSATFFKTADLEVIRLVVPAGKTIDTHEAPGEITFQCLEGRIAFTARGSTRTLDAGQMLYLAPKEPHSLRAVEDASALLTILLR
jgi:quercetin dioxygenase-like cupin family protein